ncbi:23S rRNA (guanosine(2251)-2'-O)-methyltransferase RlmB [Spiroplasma endosymbiont of Anurida maritima]|uniref:23S rRNA (guanosine(2251)-2'-O)-methyltransferase RlmB n=1 Tax=Spiroplasma endosymbiont of Anurida maritima TaxID=2967972 RepID=UPI0036D352ED
MATEEIQTGGGFGRDNNRSFDRKDGDRRDSNRGGFGGDRRDSNRGGFGRDNNRSFDRKDGDRRDSNRGGFGGDRRDSNRGGGFGRGNDRRDSNRGGFGGDRRDSNRGGFGGDRRDSNRGGFGGDRRDSNRGGGFGRGNDRRDSNRGGGFRRDKNDKSNRTSTDNLILYGVNTVNEILTVRPEIVKELFLQKESKISEEIFKDHEYTGEISYWTKFDLDRFLRTESHQGIAVKISHEIFSDLDTVIKKSLEKPQPLLLIIDQMHDPHNFGAIIRSCDNFNVDGIIVLKDRQVDLNATVAKTSAGGFLHVPVCEVTNLTQAIDALKDNGFWIYASNLNKDAQDISTLTFDKPTCLIVGNESKGVSEKVTNNSDFNVSIPTTGNISSLNVSVASALMIYQIRQNAKKIVE